MHGVCLVGCGHIARTHVRNLTGKVKLAYHSRTRESAARLAEENGGQVISTWEEVLQRPQVQALIICSPPEYHCEQVVAGLEAGKLVLVEKPMCVRPDELERIAAAAAKRPAGRLMVAENYYYKPALKLLRWLLRRDFVGQPQRIEARKLFQQRATGWKRGYGALLEGGIHFVALVSALAESCGHQAPLRIRAEFSGGVRGEPERRSRTELEYERGLTARLGAATAVPATMTRVKQAARRTFMASPS